MRICAGIVLYNPDIGKLNDNISSIIKQVDEIVLIDNASSNGNQIRKLINGFTKEIIYIRNDINKGVAKALNQIMDFAEKKNCEYFLTLDQDSICKEGLIEIYKRETYSDVAQITCRIVDRENGEVDAVSFKGSRCVEVDYCITSGCINNTIAVKRVGGFDEKLFIDGIDLDISLRLKKDGFHIIKVNFEGLIHELGEKTNKKKIIRTANHAPWRNYYTRRNIIYISRKYFKGFERHKRIVKQIAYGFGTILLEDKKRERIKYNVKGIIEGLTWPLQ